MQVLVTLAFTQGHRDVRKQKNVCVNISQSQESVWLEFGFLSSIVKGESPTYVILSQEKNDVGLHLYSYRPISSKLGMMIGTVELYI